jgi:hypothetical protein
MSDINNHLNLTFNHSENPPITSSTHPRPSTSIVVPDAVNGGSLVGNDQAQRAPPTDGTINGDHQARDSASNDQNDTPPPAVGMVEYTDDPTVRRLRHAFHTDVPRRSGVPFTLASSVAPEMTARDRQGFGLPPGISQPESASNNNQSTTWGLEGFGIFETPSAGIPPVAVTDTPVTLGVSRDDYVSYTLQSNPPEANGSGSLRVPQAADFTAVGLHANELPSHPMRRSAPPSGTAALSSHPLGEASDTATIFNSTHPVSERSSYQRPSYSLGDLELRSDDSNTAGGVYAAVHSEADCTHRQTENSNGDVTENGHGRMQVGPGTPTNTPLSVNVSELRLGLVSRESHTELALFSQYSEDELSQAAPDEDTTASSSAAPVGRRTLVIRFGNLLANHSNGRAPARPNTPLQLQTTDSQPSFDLSSHHSGRRASNDNLVHGSTPDSSTRDSTSRDDGRPTRLSNYLPGASPPSEDREAWISELIVSPENVIDDRANNTLTNAQANLTDVDSVMRNAPP